MKISILFALIIALSSCKKNEVPELPEFNQVVETSPSAPKVKSLKIDVGNHYKELSIKINNEVREGNLFDVLKGDSVDVYLTNKCWEDIYFGLGDTIGTKYTQCDENQIWILLDGEFAAASQPCYLDNPLSTCPSSCEVSYTVE